MIPSQLQTEYAGELLRSTSGPKAWGASEDDITAMVATRMQRQQILYMSGKRIQLVILEAALRTRLVSTTAHRGHLDRMLALVSRERSSLTCVVMLESFAHPTDHAVIEIV